MFKKEALLIPIKYGRKGYPSQIKPKIIEIPAHFDIKKEYFVSNSMGYSLHTEYSYSSRNFESPHCSNLINLKNSNKRGVPKLWFNKNWANEFSVFILRIIEKFGKCPSIIEIHPPFNDYSDVNKFVEVYKIFEDKILSKYDSVEILVENRFGAQYGDGSFIMSYISDLLDICEVINKQGLRLKIALDIPQLFSAHKLEIGRISKKGILNIFKELKEIKNYVASIHLWGKCYNKNNRILSHMGTLDTYFYGGKCSGEDISSRKNIRKEDIKTIFLEELYNLLNDNIERYFLPEVNSRQEHLDSIVKDLLKAGFIFLSKEKRKQ